MASDMTWVRDFALKKLNEAKQKGATLATAAATATAASISSNVPAPTAFVFRTNTQANEMMMKKKNHVVTLDDQLLQLQQSNDALRSSLTGHTTNTLDESLYMMDLINESLAFTIENLQECSHVMKLLTRQLKDNAAMENASHKDFFRKNITANNSSINAGNGTRRTTMQ